jgi:hypothetical protein
VALASPFGVGSVWSDPCDTIFPRPCAGCGGLASAAKAPIGPTCTTCAGLARNGTPSMAAWLRKRMPPAAQAGGPIAPTPTAAEVRNGIGLNHHFTLACCLSIDLFRPGFARRSLERQDLRLARLRAGGKPVPTFRDHALKYNFAIHHAGRSQVGLTGTVSSGRHKPLIASSGAQRRRIMHRFYPLVFDAPL